MNNLSYDILEIIFEWLPSENKMDIFESGIIDSSFSFIVFDKIRKSKEQYILKQKNDTTEIYIIDNYDSVIKNINKLHYQFHQKYTPYTSPFVGHCNDCMTNTDPISSYEDEECDNCIHLSDIICDNSDCDCTSATCSECEYIKGICCSNDQNTLICDECIFCENCIECSVYKTISRKLGFKFKFKKCENRICCDNCKTKITSMSCNGMKKSSFVFFDIEITKINTIPDSNGILQQITIF
jgi:hypothetical protein